MVEPITLPWQRAEARNHGSARRCSPRYALVPQSEADDILTLPSHQLGGGAEVASGAFSFDADLAGWPHGPVILAVTFAVGPEHPQPAEVVIRFGSEGEHLAGPQVFADSPGDQNEMSVTTRLRLGD